MVIFEYKFSEMNAKCHFRFFQASKSIPTHAMATISKPNETSSSLDETKTPYTCKTCDHWRETTDFCYEHHEYGGRGNCECQYCVDFVMYLRACGLRVGICSRKEMGMWDSYGWEKYVEEGKKLMKEIAQRAKVLNDKEDEAVRVMRTKGQGDDEIVKFRKDWHEKSRDQRLAVIWQWYERELVDGVHVDDETGGKCSCEGERYLDWFYAVVRKANYDKKTEEKYLRKVAKRENNEEESDSGSGSEDEDGEEDGAKRFKEDEETESEAETEIQ